MPFPYRSHAVPLPCRSFPFDLHSVAVFDSHIPWLGMCESALYVNKTRPHCVNEMGKTQSKALAERHGRGTAWYVWIRLYSVLSVRFLTDQSDRPFLGAFAKWRKATIGFVMYIHPSVHIELGFHWTDFHEIRYLRIFRKSVKEIQVAFKWDKNEGYFTWRPIHIFIILRSFLLFFIKDSANLQSTPSGAISKCVREGKPEGRSHPVMTLHRMQ
jgi:hypothetical protein